MTMAKIKVLLRSDKVLSDKSYPIWIRITQNRKSRYVSSGHSCLQEEWNSKESRLWEAKPRITSEMKKNLNPQELKSIQAEYAGIKVNSLAKVINADLSRSVRKLEGIKDKLEVNEKGTSANTIKSLYKGKTEAESSQSFIKFFEKQISILLGKERYGTAKSFNGRLSLLKQYLKGQDLTFEDITKDFLDKYEAHLKKSGLMNSTINTHLRIIKNVFLRAIKEGFIPIEKNPFLIYSIPQANKAKKERLEVEELIRLKKLVLPEDSGLFHSRNAFLFSFYCAGIRVRDLLQLKWKDIRKEGKEERLEYTMGKSSKDKSLMLQPQALGILSFYRKKQNPEAYIFPFLKAELKDKKAQYSQASSKTAIINSDLKELAIMAKIDKKLSFHIARHSFANIARKKNVPIQSVQKLLGHSSLKMTEIYLDSLDLNSQDSAHSKALQGI